MTTTDAPPVGTNEREALLARLKASHVQRTLYPLAQRLRVANYTASGKPELCERIVASFDVETIERALAALEAPAPAPSSNGHVVAEDGHGAILRAVETLLGAQRAVDPAAVRAIVAESLAAERDTIIAAAREAAREAGILRVVVENRQTGQAVDVGQQHVAFPMLLRRCQIRRPNGDRLIPVLIGPPGTGKGYGTSAVAKALSLTYSESSPLQDASDILGYRDVRGELVRTEFRDRWEHGGVHLFDEYDGSDPRAAISVNNGLACGTIAFPDATVRRHPDCIIVLAGNTDGAGTDASYTARLRQDKSTRSRLVRIRWGIDPALERHLSQGNAPWLAAVLAARETCEGRGIRDHVTPRATENGACLLAAGETFADTVDAVLTFGLRDDAAAAVKESAERAYKAHGGC